jgi:hypothetical protein
MGQGGYRRFHPTKDIQTPAHCGGGLLSFGSACRSADDRGVKMYNIDLTHAETLVYLYANPHGGTPIELEVEDPATFRVMPDGSHKITDMADVGVIMPAGWLRIEVYPNRDRAPFQAD